MENAIDVARYFLGKADRDAGDAPTHLWLQKLVYYAQAWNLVFLGRPLFQESVEAWKNGPVVPSVWQEYKKYEMNVIPEQTVVGDSLFSSNKESDNLLAVVWDRYGGLTASSLWKLTHSETPWKNARIGLRLDEASKNPISLEDMRTYYGEFGGIVNSKFLIEKRAAELNKDKTLVTVCLTDGRQEQIDLKDLGVFVTSHSGLIEYEQSLLPVEGVELF
jgi:uncharacterized phage-associated protein